ncbi:MAG: type 4a pilus biogenesis protein PilO [Planctomycetes bacterium]|nr:type 4a pilus biogenesis protein PilO [Planctomycetota bacterium]
MNLSVYRDLLVQVMMAMTVCIGSWMFLVKSKAEDLREVETLIARSRAQSRSIDHADLQKISARTPPLRRRMREIQARGSVAKDSSALYGRITDLAEKHQVKINNLRPGVEQQIGDKDRIYIVTRIDMTIVGEYENIARFLESVNGIGAYLRPISVQIAPTKGGEGSFTVIQLGIEVLRFNLPEPLVALGGTGP